MYVNTQYQYMERWPNGTTMNVGFSLRCAFLALLVAYAFLINTTDAGQLCSACAGTEEGTHCQHHTTCNNDEVCHLTVYTDEEGQRLCEYGCASPRACHHSVNSIFVGRRADTVRHDICSICCNDTNLCNQHLACSSTGTTPANLPRECSELTGWKANGTYTIYPSGSLHAPVPVYCMFGSDGMGWTVIQRRYNGSVNFYRNWQAYKAGFGSPYGEYWLGNDVIHQLTAHGNHDLRIVMTDFDGVTKYAEYTIFNIGDESSDYRMLVLNYTGNAGDSFSVHSGSKFSTYDRDNDKDTFGNCAQLYKGGWWYANCHEANLNGKYLSGHHNSDSDGVNWNSWRGSHYSLRIVNMMIRKY